MLARHEAAPAPCPVPILHRLRVLHIGVDLDIIGIPLLDNRADCPAFLESARLVRGLFLDLALQLTGKLNDHLSELSGIFLLDHAGELLLQRVEAIKAVFCPAHAFAFASFSGTLLWEGCRSASPASVRYSRPSRITFTVSPGSISTSGRTKSR